MRSELTGTLLLHGGRNVNRCISFVCVKKQLSFCVDHWPQFCSVVSLSLFPNWLPWKNRVVDPTGLTRDVVS
jgi:hypothetical protein